MALAEVDRPLWSGKKFNFGLPSFTYYSFTERQFICRTGILTHRYENIRLERIIDVSLTVPLLGRIFNYGYIKLHSLDATAPDFTMVRVRDARRVAHLLTETSLAAKGRGGVLEVSHYGNLQVPGPGVSVE